MLVADQLFVPALVGVVFDEVDPQLGAAGEIAHEALQLLAAEVATVRAAHVGEGGCLRGPHHCATFSITSTRLGLASRATIGAVSRARARSAVRASNVQSSLLLCSPACLCPSGCAPECAPPSMSRTPLAGSTTGRSDPYSSCSAPTARAIVSTARAP